MEHLDARLGTIAAMTPRCRAVADIGCDHGKLTVDLLVSGRCPKVIAADLRPIPLSKAQENCRKAGCEDRAELRLGNGLEVLQPGEATDIVIAGMGAETIMRAEALFCQGRFTDAHIELERAYAQVRDNGQINMALCCDFLSRRLSLNTDVEQRYTFAERYAELLQYHDASWINIWSATSAYYHALRGEAEEIPEIFSQHRLSDINMLAPGKPMMEMIENQVYLAQGAYARVVGYSAELLPVCEAMHYALVALHLRIQTAAAYEKLGKTEEARVWLRKALADAEADGFVMPFVENYDCLQPILAREMKNDLIVKITDLGEAAMARNAASVRPAAFDVLTAREFEIVELMVQRLSNREIAEKLYLSEGSVKQYANQIYSKLHIDGDTRTKRKQLAELLGQKP